MDRVERLLATTDLETLERGLRDALEVTARLRELLGKEPRPQPPAAAPIRVALADDDPLVRMALSTVVRDEPGLELVGAAEDTDGAVALAEAEDPDVIVLDLQMPGGGGGRATALILERTSARVVALSVHDDEAARLDMQRAGAVGYLVKGCSREEIVSALRSAVRW
jgi:DNA-binding NarL/FixJ family response regulator